MTSLLRGRGDPIRDQWNSVYTWTLKVWERKKHLTVSHYCVLPFPSSLFSLKPPEFRHKLKIFGPPLPFRGTPDLEGSHSGPLKFHSSGRTRTSVRVKMELLGAPSVDCSPNFQAYKPCCGIKPPPLYPLGPSVRRFRGNLLTREFLLLECCKIA